jgi:protoporphyrinogen oxidase
LDRSILVSEQVAYFSSLILIEQDAYCSFTHQPMSSTQDTATRQKEEIYIIGAGVSGLIAAYELEKAGFAPIVIEKSSEVGGRVKTVCEKDYDLDLGFQVLLNAYPMAQKYLDMEALNLRHLESGAQIYVNGKKYLIGDPLRNWKLLFPTLFADIGTLGDKLKIFRLNSRLKNKSIAEIFETPERSTLEYLQEFGFSEKIIRRFFQPFFSGIFLEPDLTTSSRMFEFVYKMFGEGYATIPQQGIGAISEQLKGKLKDTQFIFNTEVEEVTAESIHIKNSDPISHRGVIIAIPGSSVLKNMASTGLDWKSCMCLYFEVDQTHIPHETIGLVADTGKLSNNIYTYDDNQGRMILSVTCLRFEGLPEDEVIKTVASEVQQYTGCAKANYIHHFTINQALPDIRNLKMTLQPSESQVLDNVFLAGDHLLNGSLNAAMESGRQAAIGLLQKRQLSLPSG